MTDVLSHINALHKNIIIDSIIVGFISFAVSLFLLLRLSKKHTQALKETTKFAADLDKLRGKTLRVYTGAEELYRLGSALNTVSKKLYAQDKTIQESKDTLLKAQKIAHIGSWNWDLVKDRFDWTDEIYNIFGFEPQIFPATYDAFMKRISPSDRERVFAARTTAIEHKKPYTIEYCVVQTTGAERIISERANVYCDDFGKPLRMVGTMHDITEQTKLEHMKNEFISTVSHELRTPLTSILGSLGLVSAGTTGELPSKAAELVDIALNNSERLLNLINDILDIEKISTGKMELHFQAEPLMPLLEEALKTNKSYADKHDISFTLLDTVPEQVKVNVDRNRFFQVMSNLLSNAAKFSPSGGQVEIAVTRRDGSVHVTVRDYGEGIPEEFRHRVFQRFSQSDSSNTRKKGGTGLGLVITKSLVEKMDGSIGFESNFGAGTTFYFDLPEWQASDNNKSYMPARKLLSGN